MEKKKESIDYFVEIGRKQILRAVILLRAIGFSEARSACLEFYFAITFPHSANEVSR